MMRNAQLYIHECAAAIEALHWCHRVLSNLSESTWNAEERRDTGSGSEMPVCPRSFLT